MTEKEYEGLSTQARLFGREDTAKTEPEFRKKIRKLEKAVLKRQRKVATPAKR